MQFINSMLKTLDVDILITFGVVLLMISCTPENKLGIFG